MVVVKNSAIGVNCGQIPVARHTLRAVGQVKKRWSRSSTALLHLGQVSELNMCFLRRFLTECGLAPWIFAKMVRSVHRAFTYIITKKQELSMICNDLVAEQGHLFRLLYTIGAVAQLASV